MSRNVRLVCAGALIVLAASCSGTSDTAAAKVAVKGTVNLNGKPMPEGEISFDLGRGQPPVVLPIKDGSFSGEVFGGKNRVEVNAYKQGPPLSTDPKGPPTRVNTVDARFNFQSTLTADVTAGGPNEFKFDVRSK